MLSKATLEETTLIFLLLVDVQIPNTWNKYIFHVGSSLDLHSTIQSGWIAGGKDTKEERQAVFFTAVSSMTEPQKDEPCDVTKNHERYHTKLSGKEYQDAAYWIQSNAIIFHDLVPADCLEKVVNTKTEESLYQKASLSPRPPPKLF